MRAGLEMLPGVALCIVLAVCGDRLAARLGLPVPGAVLGLIVYLGGLLAGRRLDWSRPGAALLLRWIGAMVVPALVGLQAQMKLLASSGLVILAVLVATTLITAVATALLYRLAGGRGW